MKYDELISTCIECVQNFNPNIEGPDSYADTFIKYVFTLLLVENKRL